MKVKHFAHLLGALLITAMPAWAADSQIPAKSENKEYLIQQIEDVTAKLKEGPGPEVEQALWDLWYPVRDALRKQRIGLIEALDMESLPPDRRRAYVQLKFDDIWLCMLWAYNEGDVIDFRHKIHEAAHSGSPLQKELAEETYWKQNVYYVNTHLMSLSDKDLQTIADFEISRKESPAAGRLLHYGLTRGRVDKDTRLTWNSWILAQFPPDSEGYRQVMASNRLKAAMNAPFSFVGKNLQGQTVSSDQFVGKIVLLDFWALWCGFCLEEIPAIKRLREQYREQGLRVVGVSSDEDVTSLQQYVDAHDIGWPQMVRPGDAPTQMHPLAQQYDIRALPCYLLIGPDGKLLKKAGRVAHLEPLIEKLASQQ